MGESPACVLVPDDDLCPVEGEAGGAGVGEAPGPACALGGLVWLGDLGQGSPPCPSCLHCAGVPEDEKKKVFSN